MTILTEMSVTRNQNLNPETDIAYTTPVLIFASLANIFEGSMVGALEVVYLEKRVLIKILRYTFRTHLK